MPADISGIVSFLSTEEALDHRSTKPSVSLLFGAMTECLTINHQLSAAKGKR